MPSQTSYLILLLIQNTDVVLIQFYVKQRLKGIGPTWCILNTQVSFSPANVFAGIIQKRFSVETRFTEWKGFLWWAIWKIFKILLETLIIYQNYFVKFELCLNGKLRVQYSAGTFTCGFLFIYLNSAGSLNTRLYLETNLFVTRAVWDNWWGELWAPTMCKGLGQPWGQRWGHEGHFKGMPRSGLWESPHQSQDFNRKKKWGGGGRNETNSRHKEQLREKVWEV